jgi:hypothetical protein
LAVAIMFLLVVLIGVLLHTFMLAPLRSSTDRQLQLKSQYIYETLATAWVENYTKSYLRAAADNLVFAEPTIPSDYLSSAMDNVFEYLVPSGYAAELKLTYGNAENIWGVKPLSTEKQFVHTGLISVIKAEAAENERTILVKATLTLFWVG